MIFDDAIDSIFAECPFDHVAAAFIDFDSKKITTTQRGYQGDIWFDLASLSKALTLASTYHQHPELFGKDEILLLEHRAGLPSWGRLSKNSWRETVSKYSIVDTPHLYSDFSALRTMLELEKKSGKKLEELCSPIWDEELLHWLKLPEYFHSPETGFRRKKVVRGQVHDDNAFVIREFVSHAGMFGTVKGVSQTLLNLEEKTGFLNHIKNLFETGHKHGRFLRGWDTVEDQETTLAGKGCGPVTFGHTGFTGTSLWMDADQRVGWVLLTNSTQNYWYHRKKLNELRRTLGEIAWKTK
jgi:hypothetical protein